jgi:PAS domain S-box-containing protein
MFSPQLGYDAEQVVGRTDLELLPADAAARVVEIKRRVVETGAQQRETVSVAVSGQVHYFDLYAEPVRDASGATVGLVGATLDITERQRLEQALLDATGREQRRLSEELHDGLGQELTGLSLLAQALATATKNGQPATERDIERILQVARRAVATCRTIAHGLSPLGVTSGGLPAALRELAQLYADAHEPTVRFEAIGAAAIRLAPDVSDHLYRIAQEAFANALRHAQAKVIDIALEVRTESIRIEIRDDGRGMDGDVPGTGGFGIRTMRYRAAMIGAQLQVSRRGSGGTSVICECRQPPMA